MNITEFVSIPAIVVVVYLLAQFLKNLFPDEGFSKLIPAICGTLGGLLGVACWLTVPGFLPADNWITALAVGIVSGFAATGVHQVYKQGTK